MNARQALTSVASLVLCRLFRASGLGRPCSDMEPGPPPDRRCEAYWQTTVIPSSGIPMCCVTTPLNKIGYGRL